MIALLILGFFLTALLYASVGFGGGSTYSALLALAGTDHRILPLISLACNIVVVAGSSWRFARAGVTPWKGALVLTALAAPAAFVGGLIPIDRASFLLLLGASLVLTALTMLIPVSEVKGEGAPTGFAKAMPFAAAPIGFLAGLVGIGGGIFLAPLLHLTRWRGAREIAATASLFILVNSAFGLAGQLAKNGPAMFAGAMAEALPLLLAVVIGGQIGSLMALRVLPVRWIRWLTAALVFIVGVRLLAG
ncbi:sulfite exporter TauE/SafE family protein [Erythrobacter sp. SCSIO 43205]|uniref:sulfite exporter TauE/SafE family protein n=1 Tax=Erythrobacter sp. SCSIO 43205 TaxID=2779361 RepID=UPI001CA9AC2B|nr:sulfite exporter TauE/SafE family protein [Erythrobacter sp. SCSIO 43205]UAB79741.1 sulfite exporter TauE/SafE family protein [Erythrobacter sp. SCSIO 43205]